MKEKLSFKNIKLKYQLFSIAAIALLILVMIQVIYYNKFSSVIRNSSEVATANLLAQMEENLAMQADSIIQVGNNIAYNEYVQEFMGSGNYAMRADYIKFIRNLFEYTKISNPSIYDIVLVDDLGQMVNYLQSPDWNLLRQIAETYHGDLLTTSGSGSFYMAEFEDSPIYLYALPFSSFRNLKNREFCYILFQNDALMRTLENVELPSGSSLYLLDQDNRIIASGNRQLIGTYAGEDIRVFTESPERQQTARYQGEPSIITHSTIDGMGWTLISIIPIHALEAPLKPLKTFSLIFGFFMVLLLLGICTIIIRNITRPLNQLSAFLSDVNYQTLKTRFASTGNNEIDQVVKKINSMLEQIYELTHRIFNTQEQYYELELAKKQAEFSALQNQINPHFLYNTLDCIRSIAFSYQAAEIVSIASSMSKMFRYCIKGSNIVTVREELECINNYINIIQIRYDNRFLIEQDIDDTLLEERMIKFILQPIIENAVYHGLELKLGQGLLRITGKWDSDSDFSFEIFDTGTGIDGEMLKELNRHFTGSVTAGEPDTRKHTGIGLPNIDMRIKSLCGNGYGLTVDSIKGEWTRVKIRMRRLEEETAAQND